MTCYYFTDFDKIDDDVYRNWLARVPDFRRELAMRFRFKRDALLSLASYLLLEKALSDRYGRSIRRPAFHWNEFGKPYLNQFEIKEKPPFFNMTHTDGIAVCSLAETEVGIDIERINSVNNSIIDMVCSLEERRFLDRSDDRAFHLARFWVLKESYLKAIGCGLSIDPKNIDFSSRFPKGFSFHIYSRISGFIASVCRRDHFDPEDGAESRWIPIGIDDLL